MTSLFFMIRGRLGHERRILHSSRIATKNDPSFGSGIGRRYNSKTGSRNHALPVRTHIHTHTRDVLVYKHTSCIACCHCCFHACRVTENLDKNSKNFASVVEVGQKPLQQSMLQSEVLAFGFHTSVFITIFIYFSNVSLF